jgi:hypothetical protein
LIPNISIPRSRQAVTDNGYIGKSSFSSEYSKSCGNYGRT